MDRQRESQTVVRDDTERLLWEELDGELDNAGSRELGERLRRDSAARTLGDRITETSQLMAAVEKLAPPTDLATRIEAEITARDASAVRPAGDGSRFAQLTPWVPRFAYMAAGVMVGMLGLNLLGPNLGLPLGKEVSELYGTMGYQPDASVALQVPVAEIDGHLALQAREGSLAVTLRFPSSDPVDVILSSYGGLTLSSLDSGDARVELTQHPSAMELHLSEGGFCALTVDLRIPDATVVVTVKSDGRTVVERSFGLTELPQAAVTGTESR